MTSAAHDESYSNPRGQHRPRGGPWGFWGCGWQQARWSGRNGEGGWSAESWGPGWHAGHPSFLWPHFIPKPLLIVLMVLGFIWWWPIGLVLLAIMVSHRHWSCGHRRWDAWHGAEPGTGSGPGPGPGWKSWFGGERPPGGSSSGNHAFDEYRAETLRRLEDEQKEFSEFLERLRFAKDKAEFDQFMSERRNRPSSPPPEPPPAPAS